jgi:hypothetical protein
MTRIQKENKIKKYFTLPIEFVKLHQLMRNSFTYSKTIDKIKIEVTPCGNHLLIYIF